MQNRIDFLKSNNLLSQVSIDLLREIGDQMREVRMKEKTVVFREGDIGDAVYFVLDGISRTFTGLENSGIKTL